MQTVVVEVPSNIPNNIFNVVRLLSIVRIFVTEDLENHTAKIGFIRNLYTFCTTENRLVL